LISITGREKLAEQSRCVRIGLIRQRLVAGVIAPLSDCMFAGESKNIANISPMKIMDDSLISLIAVKDMCEEASKTIHRFQSHKRQSLILSTCKFW
jgi:hypothetical protein